MIEQSVFTDLPLGWCVTNLPVIANVRTGKKDANHAKNDGIYRFYTCAYEFLMCDTFSFNGDCLILPGNGANVGEVFYYNGKFEAYQRTYVVENILIEPKYLYYHLFANWKQKNLDKQYGSATNFIKIGNFQNYIVYVPPLPEQHRIVAKLEELFTKLDVAVDELKKAKVQIKRYRQSVLKYAFEGKLTEELQIKNKNNITETSDELLAKIKEERKKALGKKYRELPQVDTTNLPQLPKGWNWCNLEFLTTILGDGLHGTPKYTEEGEYFFINGNNLVDGKIEIKTDTKRIAREEFDKYKKSLNENSVLVSINGTLGRTAFYNNERVILGKSACYFNLFEAIEKKYIRFILISQRFIDYANKTATGSTIKNVPLSAMRGFEIPIPQFPEEQQQIVSEIERHFSVADATENIITQSLKQAERLRQSILKDAFRGKLVPQDPNDEPAEKLLERIKELKEKENMIIKKAKQKK